MLRLVFEALEIGCKLDSDRVQISSGYCVEKVQIWC